MADLGSENAHRTAVGEGSHVADLWLPGITTSNFLPKELILGIPALFAEKFAYCEIGMGLEFLRGHGLDFLGWIQTQIQLAH